MRLIALCLCALMGFAANARAQTQAAPAWPPPAERAFIDRFEGPTLHPRWFVADGWHNGDMFSSDWRASQLQLTAEGVELTMARAPEGAVKPYNSAEFRTREQYLYGYFEARMRIPRGPGLVAAFFTFTRPGDRETQNEIDMEMLGRDPLVIELTYHVGNQAVREIEVLGFDASTGFHTYAFEWRPDSIRWYIDNRLVHVSRGLAAELNRPQTITFNLWNSARMPRWLGPIDDGYAPWRMTVACVAHAPRYQGRSLCAE